MFVVSAYAPTDCSSDEEKDNFYRNISTLLRSVKSSDIVILAGDLNAQVGRLDTSELHLGGKFGVDAPRSDNGERLLQLCADHRLFLANTNFQHKRLHRLTWRPPATSQQWKQLDHIAISYRWRASIQDCRSFWSTPLDSDHALVRARMSISFSRGPQKSARYNNLGHLRDPLVAQQFKAELTEKLESIIQPDEADMVNSKWQHLKVAMQSASTAVCPCSDLRPNECWISSRSVDLIKSRRAIPAGSDYNAIRKALKHRITRSLKQDRERWWIKKAQAIELAFASGNSRSLFHLVRSTGPRKVSVSEVIKEKNGSIITSQKRRLERWAEHFSEQFSCPPATTAFHGDTQPTWHIGLQCPSEEEVRQEIQRLKGNKAPGPDGLHPLLFKNGGEALISHLTELLHTIWTQEKVPDE